MILSSISRVIRTPALHTLSKRFVTDSEYATLRLKYQTPMKASVSYEGLI